MLAETTKDRKTGRSYLHLRGCPEEGSLTWELVTNADSNPLTLLQMPHFPSAPPRPQGKRAGDALDPLI